MTVIGGVTADEFSQFLNDSATFQNFNVTHVVETLGEEFLNITPWLWGISNRLCDYLHQA